MVPTKKQKMNEGSACVAQMTSQMVYIKAKIYDKYIKFRLPMSSGIAELQQEVAKRFNRPAGTYIEAGNYDINYKDEDGKFILLACDKDVQDCMQASNALGNTTMEEFGLQCFDGYKICEMQSREKIERRKGLTPAFQELNRVLRLVCRIHDLPLAMTWVPCSACNGLMRGELWSNYMSTGVKFCAPRDSPFGDFFRIQEGSHLRKGLVAGRALSSLNMLYCSDITQLSVDEYPLVPYARRCKLSSWFTICLQNVYTGNDIYVLEFFLSARRKDNENILTRLSFILGTMDEKFQTFRLASGKELGELMPFEVIQFQNDQKVHTIQLIQATRNFSSLSSDPSSVQSSPSVASPIHSVLLIQATRNFSTLSSDLSFVQSSACVAITGPGFQDANMVAIKAKYADYTITFKLSLPCRLVELQQKVAKKLKLDAGTFHIHYEDYEDELAELILIACDEDLQAWVDASI